MSERNETIECPCYRMCSVLEVETRPWCRYRKSELPPPGMHSFDPKETWCPPGVQASLLMLAYLVAGQTPDPARLELALEQGRRWARQMRSLAGGE